MKNIMDYIKDKIYYIMGGTILLIIIIALLSSCSGRKTYHSIENEMVNAAKKYYTKHSKNLPKEDGGIVKVTINTLIESEVLDEVTDPQNKGQICSGYVEVTKVEEEYSYMPFLNCKGNYEPKYLTDIIKELEIDEYGNGVYEMNGEYIYRGDDVNNYVKFNDQLWRIIKVDNEGDIKLVLAESTKERYDWDSAYNSEKNRAVGITTDYLRTNMRKALNNYYESNFNKDSKAKIVSKNLCVGKYFITDDFSIEKECSIIKEKEKIGLLMATDYQKASLDTNCLTLENQECSNYNYLANDSIDTWLINSSSENTYEVLYLNNMITMSTANRNYKINPVVYLNKNVIGYDGNGTLEKPYIIK